MVYRTGSHAKYYHRFHVVWVTKYRFKVLHGEMRERLREIIRQTCAEMRVQIVKGALSSDHVHMFLSIPPHLALSTVMQRIKGRSSRRIQMEYPDRNRQRQEKRSSLLWGHSYLAEAFPKAAYSIKRSIPTE
jgi:putative transposase